MSEYLLETVQLRKTAAKTDESTSTGSAAQTSLAGSTSASKIQSIQGNWRKHKGSTLHTSASKKTELTASLSREKRPSQTKLLAKIQVSKLASSATPIQQLVSSAKERLNEAEKQRKSKAGVAQLQRASPKGRIVGRPSQTPTLAGQSKSPGFAGNRSTVQSRADPKTPNEKTVPSQSVNSFSFDYSRDNEKHIQIGIANKQDFESSRNQTKLESPCSELLTDSRLELVDEEAQFLTTVSGTSGFAVPNNPRIYAQQMYSPQTRMWDPVASLNQLPNPLAENSTVSVVSTGTVQPVSTSSQPRTSFKALQRKLLGAATKDVARRGSSSSKGNQRPNSMLVSPANQTMRSSSKKATSKLSKFVGDVYSAKPGGVGQLTKQPGSKSVQSSSALLQPLIGISSPVQMSTKNIEPSKQASFGWGSHGNLAIQPVTPTTPVCQDVLYPDGSFYTGDVLLSPGYLDLPLPCGHGTLQLSSGEQYVGQFGENGTFHGKGTLTTASGHRLYEGNFQNGEFGPIGTLYNVPISSEPAALAPSDSCFGFQMGRRSPDRMFTTEDFQEDTNPQLSLFESEAHHPDLWKALDLSDWTVYHGEFLDGKRSGLGTLTLSNGDKFTGEFQHDYAEGPGVYQFASSSGPSKMVGFWSQNRLTARFQEKLDFSMRSSQDPSRSHQQLTSLESPLAASRRLTQNAQLHFGSIPLTRKVSEQIGRAQKPVSPVGSSKK